MTVNMILKIAFALSLASSLAEGSAGQARHLGFRRFENTTFPVPQPTCQSEFGLCSSSVTIPWQNTTIVSLVPCPYTMCDGNALKNYHCDPVTYAPTETL